MPACNLCQINEATKSGSHIVPHFMMKRIDNVRGSSGRDNELGFTIGEFETTSYFGRSVLPEKLNNVFGEITEEDIKKNQNPLIDDDMFCSECEERISQIENRYSKTLDAKGSDSKIQGGLSFLFWVSVLWRVSISRKLGLILEKKEEEKLRRILDNYLKSDIKSIEMGRLNEDTDCQNLCYRIIRSPDYSDNEATFLFCHPSFKRPYSLIIDEYVLFFYFKKGYVDNLVQSFFGFENEIKKKPINTVKAGETKILIEKPRFNDFMNKLLAFFGKRIINDYNWMLDEIHKKLGGTGISMPSELKSKIISNITSEESKLGRRYTFDMFIKTVCDELSIYSKSTKKSE
jgi:hypothetical protein